MATARIRNLDSLGVEIGDLEFVVPQVVISELESLRKDATKSDKISATLDLASRLKTVPIHGMFADDGLIRYTKTNRCMVATMDRRLKRQIKANGCSILSFSDDRIVLENSSKI